MTPKHPTGAAAGRAKASKLRAVNAIANKATVAEEELLAPAHDEAKELVRLALEVKDLAPWEWMDETDLFAVEDPETNRVGCVSVMGALGEYHAVGVYLGAEGFYSWMDFEDALQIDPQSKAAYNLLMEIPQLQVSFAEREFLEKRDRALLKAAGLKLTGQNPLFRSYRPGYLPWFVTRAEARRLVGVLSQTLTVAKRFAENPDIFPPLGDDNTNPLLVRIPVRIDNELVWEDRIENFSRPRTQLTEPKVDGALMAELKRIPRSNSLAEADLFIFPVGIGEKDERPMALYTLLVADSRSGFIYGSEAVCAELGFGAMLAGIPNLVARLLLDGKVLPGKIMVRTDRLFELLGPLQRELGIQLRLSDELTAVDAAAEALLEQLGMPG